MTGWRKASLAIAFALAAGAMEARPAAAVAAPIRPGQHDFDWEIGTWATNVSVRLNPLTGEAPNWAEYRGTSIVQPLLSARANFVELSVAGAKGKIEGGSLRLYNPTARQWSLNYANLRNGLLTAPVFGGFDLSGRGLFYGQDMLAGRAILVRFTITKMSADTVKFAQAYSVDGGATWEDNWLAVDTRR